MTDKIITLYKQGEPAKPAEIARPIDVAKLDDKTLIIVFTDASIEMKKRCHDIKGLSMRDDKGRLWSMPALMRHLNQMFQYITIAFGRGL